MPKFFEYTATGRYYKVYKDGAYVSQHFQEREAIERSNQLKFDFPESEVFYTHEYEVAVGLTDAGLTVAKDYTPAVDQPPTITSTPSVLFNQGTADTYDFTQHVSDDGVSAVTYSVTNVLPDGLTLNPSTGILTYDGLAIAATSSHTLTAQDAVGSDTSSSFDVVIDPLSINLYIDATLGLDTNDGSIGSPWQTIAKVNAQSLADGTVLYFKKGESWQESLNITSSGNPGNIISVTSYGSGADPVIQECQIDGFYVTLDGIDFDQNKGANRVVRLRGNNITVQNCEVQNSTTDGIDIRGGSTDITIDNCEIHHLLAGVFGDQSDAHGIGIRAGTGNTVDVTVSNCNIHEVSGDSIQTDPDRDTTNNSTVNLTITDSTLWTQPLTENFNGGWVIGNSPGENALDTKSGEDRGNQINLTIDNVTCYGFNSTNPPVANRAAFNIKENADGTIDRTTVYDCEIAYRLRKVATANRVGNPDLTVMNAVIYDTEKVFRLEDGIQNLKLYNNTIGDGVTTIVQDVGIGTGSDFRNNACFGTKPSEFSAASNVGGLGSGAFNDSANDDYRHLDTATTIDEQGDTIAVVTQDRSGVSRSAPYSIGAYEVGVSTGDYAYFDTLAARPDVRNAVAFRTQADIDTYKSPAADRVSYDSVVDSLKFQWIGTGGTNTMDVNFSPAFTTSDSTAFITWEERWSSEWASLGDREAIHEIRTFKNNHAKTTSAYSGGGLQLECRKQHRSSTWSDLTVPAGAAGYTDIRSYFGNTEGPDRLIGMQNDFLMTIEEWNRGFLFIEFAGSGKISYWMTRPGVAPVAVYLQATGDPLEGGARELQRFQFQHNSSQVFSGPECFCWKRNLVVLDGVADITEAQTLVAQGSLE